MALKVTILFNKNTEDRRFWRGEKVKVQYIYKDEKLDIW